MFDLSTARVLEELIGESFSNSYEHGWHEGEQPGGKMIPEKIALMHSELSEALEEYRNNGTEKLLYRADSGKPEGLMAEYADTIIRIFDEVGRMKLMDNPAAVDLFIQAMREKMAYNRARPYRHGGKKA